MDHYAALGVSPNATNEELNVAYKKILNSAVPPPDNITRRHTALRNFSKVKNNLKKSYNLLKNKGTRNEYNKTRKLPNTTQPSETIDYTYVFDNITKSGHGHPEFDPDGLRDFQRKVNEMLRAGYKLHGDPIVTKGVINKTWTTVTYPTTTSNIMYSNNMIYQAMIKGIGGEQYKKYKLIPICENGSGFLLNLPKLKIASTYLKEGWKLYGGPVELVINRNIESNYTQWGYIYQAIVK